MMRYAVVIEKSATGFSAYVPDLPGCVAAGETEGEVRRLIREAIEFHLDGLREDGLAVPEPTSACTYVDARRRFGTTAAPRRRAPPAGARPRS